MSFMGRNRDMQRSAKVLVRGLVKFVPALAQLAGTNLTKPRTKALADLCMWDTVLLKSF